MKPKQTSDVGLGQSSCWNWRRPCKGTEHIDVLEWFSKDDETESIIMIGEIVDPLKRKPPNF